MGLLAGSTALVATACAAAPAAEAFIETPYGNMPDVTGMGAQPAWERLVDAGFYPRLFRSDAEGAAGTVVSLEVEEPGDDITPFPTDAEGAVHEELGETPWVASVRVGLSGMAQVPPTLQAGFSEEQARSALADAGFADVSAEHLGDVDQSANRVISTNPAPAAWAPLDQQVTLTVTSDITMPDIIGMDPVTATGTLVVNGLRPSPAVFEYEGSGPVVVETSAEAGQTVRAGTVVEVTYSEEL